MPELTIVPSDDFCVCGLQYAMDNGIKHGVWGGRSEKERRRTRSAARVIRYQLPTHLRVVS